MKNKSKSDRGLVEKEKYAVKIHWKSGMHEWTTKKKIVPAKNMNEALTQAIKEERRPWRWDVHGTVRPADQYRAGW